MSIWMICGPSRGGEVKPLVSVELARVPTKRTASASARYAFAKGRAPFAPTTPRLSGCVSAIAPLPWIGRRDRDAGLLGQRLQLRPGRREMDAATGDDGRTLRCRQQLCRLVRRAGRRRLAIERDRRAHLGDRDGRVLVEDILREDRDDRRQVVRSSRPGAGHG